MLKGYLAFVVVYNLTPSDYEKEMDVAIEKNVISAMSDIDKFWGVNEDNMIFSFPQDPSVKSEEMPIMVDVSLLALGRDDKIADKRQAMADKIRDYLCIMSRERHNDIIVNVQSEWRHNDFSPRD